MLRAALARDDHRMSSDINSGKMVYIVGLHRVRCANGFAGCPDGVAPEYRIGGSQTSGSPRDGAFTQKRNRKKAIRSGLRQRSVEGDGVGAMETIRTINDELRCNQDWDRGVRADGWVRRSLDWHLGPPQQ